MCKKRVLDILMFLRFAEMGLRSGEKEFCRVASAAYDKFSNDLLSKKRICWILS